MKNSFKKKIVRIYKFLVELGFNIGSEGNISIRDENRILITPSGINSKNLSENNIALIDLEGKLKNNIRPSSETEMHLMIYKIC